MTPLRAEWQEMSQERVWGNSVVDGGNSQCEAFTGGVNRKAAVARVSEGGARSALCGRADPAQ